MKTAQTPSARWVAAGSRAPRKLSAFGHIRVVMFYDKWLTRRAETPNEVCKINRFCGPFHD